jgi:hypothetical protein
MLDEVHAALARADALGAAGEIYAGLAQAVGGLAAWLRGTAEGPRMRPSDRERAEGVWTGAQVGWLRDADVLLMPVCGGADHRTTTTA